MPGFTNGKLGLAGRWPWRCASGWKHPRARNQRQHQARSRCLRRPRPRCPRHRTSYLVPPTPLFIDQQHLAALGTERDLGDTLVQPGGGRDAIDAALAAALRPLRKHADVAPEPAAAAAGDPPASSRMSTDSPPPRLQQQQQTPQAGEAGDGPAPMEEAGQTPAAAGSGGGDGEAMDVEQQQEQQEQQEQRPQQVQQPAGAPGGDEAWLGGAGEAAAGPAADPDSFDMWALQVRAAAETHRGCFLPDVHSMALAPCLMHMANWCCRTTPAALLAQKEDTARAAAAAAAAAASQPLYVLKAAKPNTFNGGVSTYDAKLEVPEEPGKPLLLLAGASAAQRCGGTRGVVWGCVAGEEAGSQQA